MTQETPAALYLEWLGLRRTADPDGRRRLVELTARLKADTAGLFSDLDVPCLGVCPDCGVLHGIASPTGLMPEHDHHGHPCPGSIKRPAHVIQDGKAMIARILDTEANHVGAFCDTAPGHPAHDTDSCPCGTPPEQASS